MGGAQKTILFSNSPGDEQAPCPSIAQTFRNAMKFRSDSYVIAANAAANPEAPVCRSGLHLVEGLQCCCAATGTTTTARTGVSTSMATGGRPTRNMITGRDRGCGLSNSLASRDYGQDILQPVWKDMPRREPRICLSQGEERQEPDALCQGVRGKAQREPSAAQVRA